MATDSLSYSGINRSITDYAGSRACEELINLRPTTDGLVPVRPFNVKFANSAYTRVFVHHTTAGDKYIGVRKVPSSYKVVVEVIGDPATVLFERTMTGSISYEQTHKMNLYVENLFFAAAGNVILFSERAIDQYAPPMENVSFIWKDGAYQEMEANVPKVACELTDDGHVGAGIATFPTLEGAQSQASVQGSVESAVNEIQESRPDLCFGTIVVAIALKTKDGNTFWTNQWMVYDPTPTLRNHDYGISDYNYYVTAQTFQYDQYNTFFQVYGGAYYVYDQTYYNGRMYVYGTRVKLKFGPLSSTSGDPNYWNGNTSMIKSVEVYASRPALYLNTDASFEGCKYDNTKILLPQREFSDMDLGDVLMYHQASIPMDALAALDQNETYPVELKFGGNIQVTNETLRVDAGSVTRYGKILSYNSRFHYYDSVSDTKVGMPTFLWAATGTAYTAHVFVRWIDSDRSQLMYLGTISDYLGKADVVIAPSLNIVEVITYAKNGGTFYVKSYRMEQSKSYNFSICTDGPYDETQGPGTVAEYETLITANKPPVVETAEPAAINVTEQYNPFVFRVEHSYLAPGNVTDIVPQQFVVTDATYGREPLDVFTTQGVYALIQGSGEVLYSWFDPISPMIAEGPAVPTEAGVFFLSGGSLYLCAGHRTTLVSDALMAGPHKYVRSAGPNSAYAKIAGSGGVVDMSGYVSAVDFETFCSGGRLSYNRFRQELYVSNTSYQYTYVLSIKYRQWFKISYTLWQDEAGSTLIKVWSNGGNTFDYLDLGNEDDGRTEIHLQTRPFSMGYQYAHVHRIVSMVSASLSSTYGDVLVAHLYGSDDLRNWTLLAYARRNGANPAMQISQIRTPSAARSWRYYTVCLTGKVYAGMEDNTDIGPFIVDYDPVVRRIG